MRRISRPRGVMVLVGACALGWPFAAPQAEQATVYQCQDKNGVTVFSGTPCGSNAQEKVIEAPNPGTGSDKRGIDALAKQYDKRQAADRKAAEKAAERAAQRESAPSVEQKTLIENNNVVSGSPYYDPYPGYYYPPHHRPRPPAPPIQQYEYKNPGISGQFPGGAPGSSGSNWQPVSPPKPKS